MMVSVDVKFRDPVKRFCHHSKMFFCLQNSQISVKPLRNFFNLKRILRLVNLHEIFFRGGGQFLVKGLFGICWISPGETLSSFNNAVTWNLEYTPSHP